MTRPLLGSELDLRNPAYIDETARLYGKVRVDEGASIWPYAVFRSEMFEISIGRHSNIQDFVMIHVADAGGTKVGEYSSITHHCTLHACTVGSNTLVGINSTIMDGAIVGDGCIIAGHTIITEGTVIPDHSIVMGQPGKVVKTRDSTVSNRANADMYYEMALGYARGDARPLVDPEVRKRLFGS